MTTLTDKAILSGADNRPPMLEKDMYDYWKSIMELYMMNRQHGRMILEFVENDALIWPIIEDNGVTRPRKYSELTPAEAIQADCDVKATKIILQGLPPEVYELSLQEHTNISTLNFFDQFESEPTNKTPLRPNDDEEYSSGRDGRVHYSEQGSNLEEPRNDEENSVTPLDENNNSDGNVGLTDEVPVFQNVLPNVTEEVGPKRSQMTSKLPARRREESSLIITSFLDEYKCSSLALDKEKRREEEDTIRSLETRSKYEYCKNHKKEPKLDKNGHENGKSTQEPGIYHQKSSKVNFGQLNEVKNLKFTKITLIVKSFSPKVPKANNICMRTRNSYFPNNPSVTIPRRRNKRRTPNVVEPELRTIVEVAPMADNRTMKELLQAPTEGYGEAIFIPKINADQFKIKTNLLQLVQANPYHGFERENPHTHINNFKRITLTLKFRDVLNDVIKLMMFLYSLEESARVWYDKEPPNSILTWDDLENASKTGDRIDKLADQISTLVDIVSKKVVTPAKVKAVEESCVTCGGNHAYYNCDATNTNQSSVYAATVQQGFSNEFLTYKKANDQMMRNMQNQINSLKGEFKNEIQNTMKTQQTVLMDQQNAFQNIFQNMLSGFFQNQASTSGTLSSNTIPNPKGEMKVITTRSGIADEGPLIPTKPSPKKVVERETEETTDKEQTNFQGSTAHIQPPVVPIPNLMIRRLYLSQIFHILRDLMIKGFVKKLRIKWRNKEQPNSSGSIAQVQPPVVPISISESDVPRTKTKPTIPYPSSFADALLLMPKFASIIKSLLANKDKLFELAKVPLIIGRSFLRTGRVLIDVYGEETTLRVNDKVITFNLNQTTRYSSTYDDMSVNRIDVVDVAREEYAQEMLGFSKNSSGGNPTSTSEPIISDSSPSLTPFKGSDFILEEIKAYLKDESISPEINHADCDPERDICLIENLLNDDPFQLPSMDLKQVEAAEAKSLIEEPLELELKDLPSHLEYAYPDEMPQNVIQVCEISDVWGIDFMRPFPSSRENRYILVAVNYLSKWVEAKALPTNDACVVVKFLKSLFARFGTPRAIISDRGTHFCNDKFAKVMSKYRVTHRLATAYHPQTSGQVEDDLWAFRTAYKTPIGCTPYKLVYGKSCHLPIELEHKAYWALKHVNFDLKTTGDHWKLQLNELHDQAYENSLIYKEKTKKLHDSKIKNRIFNVGDRVLLFNSHLKIFSRKLKTRWSGPFTITKVFPYGTIELSQSEGPNFKVNGHRVKHYFRGDIP
nr:reverse transcriptase domain-containing protein [Tanacetum cinerariifolium]